MTRIKLLSDDVLAKEKIALEQRLEKLKENSK